MGTLTLTSLLEHLDQSQANMFLVDPAQAQLKPRAQRIVVCSGSWKHCVSAKNLVSPGLIFNSKPRKPVFDWGVS